jgi:hypothetical protein
VLASVTLTLLVAAAPTPLGVAISTAGKATTHEAKLTDAILAALESDRRFTPVRFPEEPPPVVDREAALAAITAGTDAFMVLEGDEAQAKLREGTRQLLLSFYAQGGREGRDDAFTALRQAWAQRVGILVELGKAKKAKKVAATLVAIDPTYLAEGVEFVGDDARALIKKAQKRARRRKGRLQVSSSTKGIRPLVRIDGEDKGRAPVKVSVAPGLHVVELHAPGAKTVLKLVEVKAKRTAKVKDRLELSQAGADAREDLNGLDLTRPGYQRVMGQVGRHFGAPEVLFVTFREVGSALQLRARRVDIEAQTIRGASKTVVKKSASDLDEALLFSLEEVLLGERFGGQAAAPQVASAPAAGGDAPASAENGPGDEGRGAPSTTAEQAPSETASSDEAPSETALPDEAPSETPPSDEAPPAVASSDGGDVPSVASAASPVAEPEAEEESGGAALYIGAAGAAGGVGALLVVGVSAAVITAVALQGAQAPADGGTNAHRAGTTWTATGLVY